MKVKGIIEEDFANYKKASMYIAFPYCSFKCDELNSCKVCQNSPLSAEPTIEIDEHKLIERYLHNPITQAIVISGLEPFDSIIQLSSFIKCVREEYQCNDDIVIYTGYTEEELLSGMYEKEKDPMIADYYHYICSFPNIIIKFGRFIMNNESHFDNILGVNLASHNQYAKKVSHYGTKNQEEPQL